jgi:hypothetical protein
MEFAHRRGELNERDLNALSVSAGVLTGLQEKGILFALSVSAPALTAPPEG